jgi:hypothetical protein
VSDQIATGSLPVVGSQPAAGNNVTNSGQALPMTYAQPPTTYATSTIGWGLSSAADIPVGIPVMYEVQKQQPADINDPAYPTLTSPSIHVGQVDTIPPNGGVIPETVIYMYPAPVQVAVNDDIQCPIIGVRTHIAALYSCVMYDKFKELTQEGLLDLTCTCIDNVTLSCSLFWRLSSHLLASSQWA